MRVTTTSHEALARNYSPLRCPYWQNGIVARSWLKLAARRRHRIGRRGENGVGRVRHHRHVELYYADPDDNSVELFVDNCGSWDLSQAYIRTAQEFAAKPMGTYVDPDHLLAARQAGMSFAKLHQRAHAGEFAPARSMNPRDLL